MKEIIKKINTEPLINLTHPWSGLDRSDNLFIKKIEYPPRIDIKIVVKVRNLQGNCKYQRYLTLSQIKAEYSVVIKRLKRNKKIDIR